MITAPIISLVFARSKNGVIGRGGDLPWRMPSDLKQFKKTTLGKPVLMGRKTWQSLPFALPGRPNLVLSRDENFTAKGAETFTDLTAMLGRACELAGASGGNEVMVIGGAQIYAACLPFAARLYISEIEANIDGDTFAPNIDETRWVEVQNQPFSRGPKDDYAFTFKVLEREI